MKNNCFHLSSKIVGVFEVRKLFFTQKQNYYTMCCLQFNFKEGYNNTSLIYIVLNKWLSFIINLLYNTCWWLRNLEIKNLNKYFEYIFKRGFYKDFQKFHKGLLRKWFYFVHFMCFKQLLIERFRFFYTFHLHWMPTYFSKKFKNFSL